MKERNWAQIIADFITPKKGASAQMTMPVTPLDEISMQEESPAPQEHPEPEQTMTKQESIARARKVQRKQEKKWDELNEDSFPASDPVARY